MHIQVKKLRQEDLQDHHALSPQCILQHTIVPLNIVPIYQYCWDTIIGQHNICASQYWFFSILCQYANIEAVPLLCRPIEIVVRSRCPRCLRQDSSQASQGSDKAFSCCNKETLFVQESTWSEGANGKSFQRVLLIPYFHPIVLDVRWKLDTSDWHWYSVQIDCEKMLRTLVLIHIVWGWKVAVWWYQSLRGGGQFYTQAAGADMPCLPQPLLPPAGRRQGKPQAAEKLYRRLLWSPPRCRQLPMLLPPPC